MRGPALAALSAVIVFLVACSESQRVVPDAGPPSIEPSPSVESSPTAEEQGATPSFEPGRVEVRLREVASGLSMPLGIVAAGDGSGRIFIVEQTGAIRVLSGGEVSSEPFLDISDRIVSGGEQGLLGLAVHPEFERNGRLFVNYTDTNGDTVVAEYRAAEGGNADPASERVMLQIDQPFSNHNGGHIAFGPDGYLYIATGDGGSGGDPFGNGQNLETLLGKLLRIDVDASRGERAYAIPDDNPFVDCAGARPEIWAYGLRNPWRFSFDVPAGRLWTADVGQSAFEEVNRASTARGGLNFGWNAMEGRQCFASGCDAGGKVLPVSGYGHGAGCSITGGFVYRGARWPKLRGGYLFGDYCSGTMWVIDSEARSFVQPTVVFRGDLSISSFGVGTTGELFVADLSGSVFSVTAP
jgi:glucose/arabinose dehydrogenase